MVTLKSQGQRKLNCSLRNGELKKLNTIQLVSASVLVYASSQRRVPERQWNLEPVADQTCLTRFAAFSRGNSPSATRSVRLLLSLENESCLRPRLVVPCCLYRNVYGAAHPAVR